MEEKEARHLAEAKRKKISRLASNEHCKSNGWISLELEKITVCTGFGRNVERHLRDAKIQHSSKQTSNWIFLREFRL